MQFSQSNLQPNPYLNIPFQNNSKYEESYAAMKSNIGTKGVIIDNNPDNYFHNQYKQCKWQNRPVQYHTDSCVPTPINIVPSDAIKCMNCGQLVPLMQMNQHIIANHTDLKAQQLTSAEIQKDNMITRQLKAELPTINYYSRKDNLTSELMDVKANLITFDYHQQPDHIFDPIKIEPSEYKPHKLKTTRLTRQMNFFEEEILNVHEGKAISQTLQPAELKMGSISKQFKKLNVAQNVVSEGLVSKREKVKPIFSKKSYSQSEPVQMQIPSKQEQMVYVQKMNEIRSSSNVQVQQAQCGKCNCAINCNSCFCDCNRPARLTDYAQQPTYINQSVRRQYIPPPPQYSIMNSRTRIVPRQIFVPQTLVQLKPVIQYVEQPVGEPEYERIPKSQARMKGLSYITEKDFKDQRGQLRTQRDIGHIGQTYSRIIPFDIQQSVMKSQRKIDQRFSGVRKIISAHQMKQWRDAFVEIKKSQDNAFFNETVTRAIADGACNLADYRMYLLS